jgi:SAM-dependent methyltransferase
MSKEVNMSTDTVMVDPANAAQLAAWNGDEGAYWAAHAEYFDRAIAGHDRPFQAAAAIQPTDRVLDVGCGSGQDTRDAARTARSGSALGVDLSGPMLDYARKAAETEGLTNASFLQADAQIYRFEQASFDVAICRTSAMFFADPVAALSNIARALRPGGRLVLLTWQPLAGNEWLGKIANAFAAGREPRIPPPGVGPFSLSDPNRIRAFLGEAGYGEVKVVGNEAPMWFGADATDACQFILGQMGWMLAGLDDDGRGVALEALRVLTAAHQTDEGVTFASATWITTARVG